MSTLKLRTVCLVLFLTLLAAEASSKATSKSSKSKGKRGGGTGSSAYASSSASSSGTSKTSSSSTSHSIKRGASKTHSVQTTERGISSGLSATGTGHVHGSGSAASSQTAKHDYKCCRNTSLFYKTDEGVHCGCTPRAGSGQVCYFKVVREAPIVVKNIFGMNKGQLCQCSDSSSRTSTIATT